jgi:hypothetical protein
VPFPVQQAVTTAGATLVPHKLGVIAALTYELMVSSAAEQMVRQVLIESTGPAIDKQLFSATAGDTVRPAGLLNGIVALTPAAAGEKAQVIVDDLAALATSIAPVAGNDQIVLICAPAQAVAVRLRLPAPIEWPVLTSSSLAAGTVIAVATNVLVAAIESTPTIVADRESEVVFNTVPGEVVDVGGVMAAPIGSIFQSDKIALKMKWPITWARRDVRGVAWMSGVNW